MNIRFTQILPLACCLLSIHLSAQEKGVVPLSPSSLSTPSSPFGGGREGAVTRAVVIGISDYQDPAIPDLQFADRDAEAFAEWLLAGAGAGLSSEQVMLLTNENATTGKILAGFDWLIKDSRPGDKAIIYFSGHGDVESISSFQRGYLLTYNTPATVYVNGGFEVRFIEDIITSLSEKNVQVIMISDACRAGKLAGSEIGGAKATAAALKDRFANEVKILSCQPDEYSIEGTEWGGGRGVFSYYLVDGLYGLADQDANLEVNLFEIQRYVQDMVSRDVSPQSQMPLTVGNLRTPLASVQPEWVEALKAQKNAETLTLKSVEMKSLEAMVLAGADSSIQQLYAAFEGALKRGELLAPQGASADDYYRRLLAEPQAAPLHGLMTRNFVAVLVDVSQEMITKMLNTDPLFADNVYTVPFNAAREAAHLHRATELIGSQHYMYKTLKAREYYCIAKSLTKERFPQMSDDSIFQRMKNAYLEGLRYDCTAVYLLQGSLMGWAFTAPDTLLQYIDILDRLAPSWALGQWTLATCYREPRECIRHFQNAIAADSNFLSSYNWIAWPHEQLGQKREAQNYRLKYIQKMKERIAADSTKVTASLYNDMGNALWRLHKYREAEQALLLGEKKADGKLQTIYGNLNVVYVDLGKYEKSLEASSKLFQLSPTPGYHYSAIGNIYQFFLNEPQQAEEAFISGLRATSTNLMDGLITDSLYFLDCLLVLYTQTGQTEKTKNILNELQNIRLLATDTLDGLIQEVLFFSAETYLQVGDTLNAYKAYRKLSNREDFLNAYDYMNHPDYAATLIAMSRLGRQKDLNNTIAGITEKYGQNSWHLFELAKVYAMTNQPEKALDNLEKLESLEWYPNPAIWITGTVADPLLYPLKSLPRFQAWVDRWGPPYKDESTN